MPGTIISNHFIVSRDCIAIVDPPQYVFSYQNLALAEVEAAGGNVTDI